MHFLLLGLALLANTNKHGPPTLATAECVPNFNSAASSAHNSVIDDSVVPVYWVNLAKSTDRREEMEAQFDRLGYHHRRVEGVSMAGGHIRIPADVKAVWNTKQALFQSSEDIMSGIHSGSGVRVVLSGLYGRKGTNRLSEVGCTVSHLLAIHQAVHSTEFTSRYALITEDDVLFPFEIDWTTLARSAPAGFGILQMFNSNHESLRSSFGNYQKARANGKLRLWHERVPKMPASFWSTCAYLIDREVMQPVIDSIVSLYAPPSPVSPSVPPVFDVKLIAGLRWECVPLRSPCCIDPANYTYSERPPCVYVFCSVLALPSFSCL
jgi:GR25 family glycosyltransferase involved in LPS biosynthesis